jgi:hypothetical protein
MRTPILRAASFLFACSVAVQAQAGAPPDQPSPVECRDYAAKLDSCSPYTCTFTHPITGATLERKIVGLTGATCTTIEAVPGNHTMQCEFPADVRKAVARFFRETQAAEAGGKTIAGRATTDGSGNVRSTTTIAGKPVANPLQEALERGMCKVGGQAGR